MIEKAINLTNEYLDHISKDERKRYGQFFTSKETAMFMSSLFDVSEFKEEISILDPGAGTGILSVALLEYLRTATNLKKINLTCYENDPNVLDILRLNLEEVCKQSKKNITYNIIQDNYIVSQSDSYNSKNLISNLPKYDFVIGNPPYMKIAKDAEEALTMPDVCYGAPNMYFLFATMSLFNLKENGEMVYIIPRSWTSGAYFKSFRKKLFKDGVLEHIHLFVQRDKVFDKENVLQETMIIKVKKTKIRPDTITITTSQSNSDFLDKTIFNAPYSTVVNEVDSYVYLITNSKDIKVINSLKRLSNTLPSLGLKMKTGLTVDFRNHDLLRNKSGDQTVPLFYAQHMQNGKVVFPIGKENEYLVPSKKGLLQANKNYLFVKRFSSKEEKKRLQCAVYLSSQYPNFIEISTQNKINFIEGKDNLSDCTVYGLYVLFNSTLYDCYYRVLNGSTQVNSTEINSMPMPSLEIINSMGKKLLISNDMSINTCDNILKEYIK